MCCGQAQRTTGEEDRLAEERKNMDRRTGDETGQQMENGGSFNRLFAKLENKLVLASSVNVH